MRLLRSNVRERLEDEQVFGDFLARQLQALAADDLVAVQQQVDVQRPRRELRRTALPAGVRFHLVQHVVDFLDGKLAIEADHEIQEILAVEAHRRGAVHRRDGELAEGRAQRGNGEAHVLLGFDVAADADVDAHQRARSMITPTSRAPRTAPVLLSTSRTRLTGNSSRMRRAMFSASASTSAKPDASTYSRTRCATAL